MTFGEFNVSDVRPAQLFDVLADLEGQLKWDTAMTEARGVFSEGLWKSGMISLHDRSQIYFYI